MELTAAFLDQQISFARTRSDAVVKRLDKELFEEHKAKRLQRKSSYISFPRYLLAERLSEETRYTNPIKRRFRAKRLTAESASLRNINLVLNKFTYRLQWTVLLQRPPPGGPMYKCQMNICHPTKFSSSRTCQKALPKINSWLSFLSSSLLYFWSCPVECDFQVSEPIRSSSHCNQKRHCLRRVYGRGECYCCKRRSPQLQTRWRE
jgi:hypothetical protein